MDFLERIKTFEKIDIYKVKDKYFRSPIYLSRDIIALDGLSFTFDSWNSYEDRSFSLINSSTDDFGDSFSRAYVVGMDLEDNADNVKVSKFDIKSSGEYSLYINITDDRKVSGFALNYKIDGGPFRSRDIKIVRDELIEPQVDIVGFRDSYRDFFVDKVYLSQGAHTFTLKGDLIKPDYVNGINYAVFNKYFDNESSGEIPSISYRKVNASYYDITIGPSQESVLLNFAQNFDNGWKLYKVDEKGEKEEIKNHFTVNVVNNGWYIDKDVLNVSGEAKLVLEYYPQRYFYVFLVLSVASTMSIMVYLLRRRNDT